MMWRGAAELHVCSAWPCRQHKTTNVCARTPDNTATDAVFHAPMFALNADANPNACEPSRTRSIADGKGSHVFGADTRAPKHTHTRARAHGRTSVQVCCAGPHRVIRSSMQAYAWM
jgi:hypothetical protein